MQPTGAGNDVVTVHHGEHEFSFVGPQPNDYIHHQIKSTGKFYEVTLLDALAAIPFPERSIALDVGANIGNHSIFFSRILGLQVLAFEPIPSNITALRANIELNALQEKIQIYEYALGKGRSSGTAFQRVPGNAGTFVVEPGHGRIAIESFDENFSRDLPVSLVKIDVEGYEQDVIRGMEGLLDQQKPALVVEAHDAVNVRQISTLLHDLGYIPVDVQGLSDNYIFLGESVGNHISREYAERLLVLRALRRNKREVEAHFRKLESKTIEAARPERHHPSWYKRSPSVAAHDDLVETQLLGRLIADVVHSCEEFHRDRTEAQTKMLEAQYRAQAWEKAYTGLARSRALKLSRSVRRLLGRSLATQDEIDSSQVDVEARRFAKRSIKKQLAPTRPALPIRHPSLSVLPSLEVVRVGIATIPERERQLEQVISSLYDQVDEICVWLNNFDHVPDFLFRSKIRVSGGRDLGDRGKFAFLDGFHGYYLSVDDDIVYPDYYVRHIVDGIERYGRRAIVGWHGSQILDGFADYYDPGSRRVLTFGTERREDTPVDIIGTGCAGFHTTTFRIGLEDFDFPNMADVFVSRMARDNGVPLIVLNHRGGEARPIETSQSIFSASKIQLGTAMDAGGRTTAYVADNLPMVRHAVNEQFARGKLSVALVGRTDRDHWKKGGILESAHLSASMLKGLGVDVSFHDLNGLLVDSVMKVNADVTLVYPGDPRRPDFRIVHALVRGCIESNRPVLINLSHNLRPDRLSEISGFIEQCDPAGTGLVRPFVFTSDLAEVADLGISPVLLPKTVRIPAAARRNFAQTHGIFLGDYGKLCNRDLFDYPVEAWLDAIRWAVPEARLTAVEQYRPATSIDLDLEIRPYSKDLVNDLADVRLMVSPFRYCTFEMVPLELAASGLPVVYRAMPQSLSSYLGSSGFEVSSPDEMARSLATLYHDATIWQSFSASGSLRAASSSHQLQAAHLYLRLAAFARSFKEE